MPNILRINKLQISLGKVELFYLFVACSFTSREATVLLLVGYGLACPKVSEITDHQYLWEELGDFVDFLHVIIWILLDVH